MMHLRNISLFFALASLVGVLFVLYAIFWPVKTATVHNEPFDVIPDRVMRGDVVLMPIHFTKYENYETITTRSLICKDGTFLTLSRQESAAPIGEYFATVEVLIPLNAPIGECYIESLVTYDINALKHQYNVRKSKWFTITE